MGRNMLLKQALGYYKRGWSLIPIAFKKKPPKGFTWAKYQTNRPTESDLQKWFDDSKYKNLAVIVGDVSGGLAIIDFDSIQAYEWWSRKYPELAGKLPTVKTSRGRHVYFRSKSGENKKYNKIDLLAKNKYAILPPSLHPDTKSPYEWLIPLNGELPELDPLTWNLEEFTEDTEDIEEIEDIEAISKEVFAFENLDREAQSYINEAIKCTLPDKQGYRNSLIFQYCRWLKGYSKFEKCEAGQLKPLVKLWHEKALPAIGTKSFDETWADFAYGWPKVKYPKGEDKLKTATQNALNAKNILTAEKLYEITEIKLLVKVCYELQQLQNNEPFWLSCRSAAGILGVSPTTANKWLQMLVADKVLIPVEKHTDNKATRYKFIAK